MKKIEEIEEVQAQKRKFLIIGILIVCIGVVGMPLTIQLSQRAEEATSIATLNIATTLREISASTELVSEISEIIPVTEISTQPETTKLCKLLFYCLTRVSRGDDF